MTEPETSPTPEVQALQARIAALEKLVRQHELLVKPRRRRRCRTTWAGHWRCENRLAEARLTGPHPAYVSDITYLEMTGALST